jgi:glyoxylase-like metal-dependent hydrolase (beta-lactamase superfamily II)
MMPSPRSLSVLMMAAVLAACAKQPEPQATESAPAASVASENVYTFKIGELSAFALKDGTFVFPNDNKIVAVGRSPEEVANLLQAAGLATDQIELSIQPLLVKAADKTLLFDTGAGATVGDVAGKLRTSLGEAGVDPASVDDIFISHLHVDHVGGLIDAEGALVFPNATVHLSAPEWAALQAQAEQDANYAKLVQAIESKVAAFEPGAEIVPGLVKAVEIRGHTPGHSGYLITSGGESLLYIGDTAHHSIVSVQEPDWTIQFDGDAPTAQASRKEVLATGADSGQRIYAVHFPFPGLGRFAREGERIVWVPEN